MTSAAFVSFVIGNITIFAVAVGFCYGWLEQRIGLQASLTLGFAACGIGLAIIGLIPNLAADFLCAVFLGVHVVGIVTPYPFHAVGMETPEHMRVKALGVVNASIFLEPSSTRSYLGRWKNAMACLRYLSAWGY